MESRLWFLRNCKQCLKTSRIPTQLLPDGQTASQSATDLRS